MLPAISFELLLNGAIPNLLIYNIDSLAQDVYGSVPHCMNHPNMRHRLEGNPIHGIVKKTYLFNWVALTLNTSEGISSTNNSYGKV